VLGLVEVGVLVPPNMLPPFENRPPPPAVEEAVRCISALICTASGVSPPTAATVSDNVNPAAIVRPPGSGVRVFLPVFVLAPTTSGSWV
jgi:hypothetical protein